MRHLQLKTPSNQAATCQSQRTPDRTLETPSANDPENTNKILFAASGRYLLDSKAIDKN